MRNERVMLAAAALCIAVLTACGSDAVGAKDYTSADFSCVTKSPLKNGTTPGGTDLCLGATATFHITSLADDVPGTVEVSVTSIAKGSAADLAKIARYIPKDVSVSENDLYYVNTDVTLTSTDNAAAFKGDDPLSVGIALQTDQGSAQGYVGVRTDTCVATEFDTGRLGATYTHCDVLFTKKGAKPVSVTFTNTDGTGSFADNQVRWSTKKK